MNTNDDKTWVSAGSDWQRPTPEPEQTPTPPVDPDDSPIVLNPERPPVRAVRRAIESLNRRREIDPVADSSARPIEETIPWEIDQYLQGQIKLDEEMTLRFPNVPLMSIFSERETLRAQKQVTVLLSTQDGSAQVVFDINIETHMMQISFGFGSMLSLRFRFDELSDADRQRWLQDLAREGDRPGFLWGSARWERDYMISIVKRYFTTLYAFSIFNFEAAVRMTPDVAQRLHAWLEKHWGTPQASEISEW